MALPDPPGYKRRSLTGKSRLHAVSRMEFQFLKTNVAEIFIDFKIKINNKKAHIKGCCSINKSNTASAGILVMD
jgi:hypothetical protein